MHFRFWVLLNAGWNSSNAFSLFVSPKNDQCKQCQHKIFLRFTNAVPVTQPLNNGSHWIHFCLFALTLLSLLCLCLLLFWFLLLLLRSTVRNIQYLIWNWIGKLDSIVNIVSRQFRHLPHTLTHNSLYTFFLSFSLVPTNVRNGFYILTFKHTHTWERILLHLQRFLLCFFIISMIIFAPLTRVHRIVFGTFVIAYEQISSNSLNICIHNVPWIRTLYVVGIQFQCSIECSWCSLVLLKHTHTRTHFFRFCIQREREWQSHMHKTIPSALRIAPNFRKSKFIISPFIIILSLFNLIFRPYVVVVTVVVVGQQKEHDQCCICMLFFLTLCRCVDRKNCLPFNIRVEFRFFLLRFLFYFICSCSRFALCVLLLLYLVSSSFFDFFSCLASASTLREFVVTWLASTFYYFVTIYGTATNKNEKKKKKNSDLYG